MADSSASAAAASSESTSSVSTPYLLVSVAVVPPRFGLIDNLLENLDRQTRIADEIVLVLARAYAHFGRNATGEAALLALASNRARIWWLERDLGPVSKLIGALQHLRGASDSSGAGSGVGTGSGSGLSGSGLSDAGQSGQRDGLHGKPRVNAQPMQLSTRGLGGAGKAGGADKGASSKGVAKGGGARVHSSAPKLSQGPRLSEAQMQANWDAMC